MKKVLAVLLSALLLVALAGCNKQEKAPTEGFLEGTVADVSADTLLVQADDGVEYLFEQGEAWLEGAETFGTGDEVRVYYTGDLEKDTNKAQPVTLVRIVVTGSQQAVEPQPDNTSGNVTDATMNTVTIEMDGIELTFSTMDADIDGSLSTGAFVTIYFTGQLNVDVQVQDVTVQRVEVHSEGGSQQPAAQQPASQQPAPQQEVKTLEGTVEDVAPAALYMSDATGVIYQFSTTGVDIEGELAEGGAVTVYYIGKLWSQPDVQDVTVTKIVGG